MSAQANKALVLRMWGEFRSEGKLEVADEIMAPEYAAADKPFVAAWRAAFPDSYFEVHDLICEGNKVVTRATWRGTHLGPNTFPMVGRLEPTGKRVEVTEICLH